MLQKIIRLFAVLFCLSINVNTSSAQIKKIYLKDEGISYGTTSFSLYQRFSTNKGRLIGNNYGFIGTDELSFGRNGDFLIEHLVEGIPFGNAKTSLDNSTVIGTSKDTFFVFDIASEKIVNQFVFQGDIRRTMLNNDGSMAIIETRENNNKIIDTNTGKTLKEISFDIENFSFSANNRYLALNATNLVHVYDLWEGGEPFVYVARRSKKKKRNSWEYIWEVTITSNGLMALAIARKGNTKKGSFKKQEYAVVDVKIGNRIFEIKLEEDDSEWYLYSLDPTGQVLYARGKFYNIKENRELEIIRKGEKKQSNKYYLLKFHPHLPGVYHAENGKGVIGMYSFE